MKSFLDYRRSDAADWKDASSDSNKLDTTSLSPTAFCQWNEQIEEDLDVRSS